MSPAVTGIFVPGLCCRSEIWEGARAALPGVDVALLDWPWPERLRSYDDCADWLAEQIEQRRPRFVVGHSFGGIVALHLASRVGAPEWRLVIVESFLVTRSQGGGADMRRSTRQRPPSQCATSWFQEQTV